MWLSRHIFHCSSGTTRRSSFVRSHSILLKFPRTACVWEAVAVRPFLRHLEKCIRACMSQRDPWLDSGVPAAAFAFCMYPCFTLHCCHVCVCIGSLPFVVVAFSRLPSGGHFLFLIRVLTFLT